MEPEVSSAVTEYLQSVLVHCLQEPVMVTAGATEGMLVVFLAFTRVSLRLALYLAKLSVVFDDNHPRGPSTTILFCHNLLSGIHRPQHYSVKANANSPYELFLWIQQIH
jgi:hypothetical protein